jgi:integrase/recombinase XerC
MPDSILMKSRGKTDKSPTPEREIERSIAWAIEQYIHTLQLARSPRTAATYQNALNGFKRTLIKKRIDPGATSISDLSEDAIGWFAEDLKAYSPATETLYLTATAGFFDFLAAEELLPVNLPRIRLLIHQRSRRAGQRLPQFPRGAIDELLEKADYISKSSVEDKVE